ncbi:MAG: DUF5666 domain-containing protein [Caldilineales bacterium]
MKRVVALCAAVFTVALLVGLLVSQRLPARAPNTVSPQTPPTDATPAVSLVTFEGLISQGSSAVPSTWVVNSLHFRVISDTQVITNGQTVQPGVWARVDAVKDSQGTLEARTVALQSVPTGEIFDRIVAIDAGEGIWQVGDTDVLVSDQTNVQGTPAVDALVYVHGRWSLDGLAADQAVVQSAAEQAVYQGRIVRQQPNEWLVDDVVVDLSGSPSIAGEPEIGALVEVYGVETSPRHLRAYAIIVSDGSAEFQQREGWLVSVAGEEFPFLWRVNLLEGTGVVPVYVAVYENTVVDETAGTAVYRSWLDIQADSFGGNYFRARRIVVLPRPPKQTITGIVEQMPSGSTIGQWRVSGHRVEVVADTAIIGAPHVGSLVTVHGTPDYSNKLLAESMQALGQ